MHSRDLIRQLQKDGWYEVNQGGSRKQFKHPTKKGRGTVPHPNRDIPIGTLKSIEKQAGIKLRGSREARSKGANSMEYRAYLHKDGNSDYGVSFPDFPGCITAGKTLDEASRMAAEALALPIQGMIEGGGGVPGASQLD